MRSLFKAACKLALARVNHVGRVTAGRDALVARRLKKLGVRHEVLVTAEDEAGARAGGLAEAEVSHTTGDGSVVGIRWFVRWCGGRRGRSQYAHAREEKEEVEEEVVSIVVRDEQ